MTQVISALRFFRDRTPQLSCMRDIRGDALFQRTTEAGYVSPLTKGRAQTEGDAALVLQSGKSRMVNWLHSISLMGLAQSPESDNDSNTAAKVALAVFIIVVLLLVCAFVMLWRNDFDKEATKADIQEKARQGTHGGAKAIKRGAAAVEVMTATPSGAASGKKTSKSSANNSLLSDTESTQPVTLPPMETVMAAIPVATGETIFPGAGTSSTGNSSKPPRRPATCC